MSRIVEFSSGQHDPFATQSRTGSTAAQFSCQWRSRMFNRRKHGLCRSSEPGHEDQELQMSIERMELR